MLVYLVFIFACGWCVCWLLFLNYQQYSRDSRRQTKRTQRNQRNRLKRQLWTHASRASSSSAFVDSATGGPSQFVDLEALAPLAPLESVVVMEEDQRRSACLLSGERRAAVDEAGSADKFGYDKIDDDEDDDDDEEEEEDDERCAEDEDLEREFAALGLGQLDEPRSIKRALCTCAEAPPEFRGWPGGAEEAEEADEQSQQADEGEHQLWPIVALHENPLNFCPSAGAPKESPRSRQARTIGKNSGDNNCSTSMGAGISESGERSRLFSLAREQLERRAAIRMISNDSVQLLVQANQQVTGQQEEQQQAQQQQPTSEKEPKTAPRHQKQQQLSSNNEDDSLESEKNCVGSVSQVDQSEAERQHRQKMTSGQGDEQIAIDSECSPATTTSSGGLGGSHRRLRAAAAEEADGGGGGEPIRDAVGGRRGDEREEGKEAPAHGEHGGRELERRVLGGAGDNEQRRPPVVSSPRSLSIERVASASSAPDWRPVGGDVIRTGGNGAGDSAADKEAQPQCRETANELAAAPAINSTQTTASSGTTSTPSQLPTLRELQRQMLHRQQSPTKLAAARAMLLHRQQLQFQRQQQQNQSAGSSSNNNNSNSTDLAASVHGNGAAAKKMAAEPGMDLPRQPAKNNNNNNGAKTSVKSLATKFEERQEGSSISQKPNQSLSPSPSTTSQAIKWTTPQAQADPAEIEQQLTMRAGVCCEISQSQSLLTTVNAARGLVATDEAMSGMDKFSKYYASPISDDGQQGPVPALRTNSVLPTESQGQARTNSHPTSIGTNSHCPSDEFNILTGANVDSSSGIGVMQNNNGIVPMHPRVNDLSKMANPISAGNLELSNGSGLSTPSEQSISSDASCSTTTTNNTTQLYAELSSIGRSDINSSELIPKLIERLDRKLVVMKKEQLTLMREIELNEATGQRLFESMKQQLTSHEYDKICLHANEIEKVTKLILSLKLRLKRVESELKERSAAEQQQQVGAFSENKHQTSTSQEEGGSESKRLHKKQLVNQITPSQQQQQQQQLLLQQPRSVSDPTSTTGLPKRNHHHQHHASLKSPSASEDTLGLASRTNYVTARQQQQQQQQQQQHEQHVSSGCSSRTCSPIHSPASSIQSNIINGISASDRHDNCNSNTCKITNTKNNSNDSIFNCADSAIGGSCTLVSSTSSARSDSSANEEPNCGNTGRRRTRHHHHHHNHQTPSQTIADCHSLGSSARSSLTNTTGSDAGRGVSGHGSASSERRSDDEDEAMEARATRSSSSSTTNISVSSSSASINGELNSPTVSPHQSSCLVADLRDQSSSSSFASSSARNGHSNNAIAAIKQQLETSIQSTNSSALVGVDGGAAPSSIIVLQQTCHHDHGQVQDTGATNLNSATPATLNSSSSLSALLSPLKFLDSSSSTAKNTPVKSKQDDHNNNSNLASAAKSDDERCDIPSESRNASSSACPAGSNLIEHKSILSGEQHLLTDTDILLAKRNKLVSQLDEAHQLEECILGRNSIIVERILKKYYDETAGGEISEFKQFTKLKSLLLKDSHYVADRIDHAELQLIELKRSNISC